MVELVQLQAVAYVAQILGVIGTLTAAFIAVRSYINANKRAEEARARELETRQLQLFMNIYKTHISKTFQHDVEQIHHVWEWKDLDARARAPAFG
jgi:beta-lactamase regulating signal transducer with metallopeptidase domain